MTRAKGIIPVGRAAKAFDAKPNFRRVSVACSNATDVDNHRKMGTKYYLIPQKLYAGIKNLVEAVSDKKIYDDIRQDLASPSTDLSKKISGLIEFLERNSTREQES
jgi:DNA topoisomerase IB